MVAERAGYTVTMFLVDVSKTMAKTRIVELPDGPKGETRTTEMTNLEWSLQFVKLKIQEMIYNGRKTDKCGVIVFGHEETSNVLAKGDNGYENVLEYIPIDQPNADTLAKLDALRPSDVYGDPIDALIVAIETQDKFLGTKKTWTRKVALVTDGENPIEVEDWDLTCQKMNEQNIIFTVVGIDFDDEEYGFEEEEKSDIKRANEEFYKRFVEALDNGVYGTYAYALSEISRPDIKITKSVLSGTVLRLGDVDARGDEAFEIMVKTSKCTAQAKAKSWKKFAVRKTIAKDKEEDAMEVDVDPKKPIVYAQLKMRTEYRIEEQEDDEEDEKKVKEETEKKKVKEEEKDEDGDVKMKGDDEFERVEKEDLVRGFKYGTSYVPCPDGQFPRLPTRKGIDICGFFSAKNFRRELAMSEVQYIWADPASPKQQVALSSIVQAMEQKEVLAIGRWVSKDGMDPKMGVLQPRMFDKVDCLLWTQMPFSDDVRKYTFASLDNLISKGNVLTTHPYIPTEAQMKAMDDFVDSMDLMKADKDDDGNRCAWYDTRLSYNPAVHRVKQALFHCAVVSDLDNNPLPPPHPEILKYFKPPKKVLKNAKESIEKVKEAMNVRQVPKRIAKTRKDGQSHAALDDDEMLLLDRKPSIAARASPAQQVVAQDSDTEESETEDVQVPAKRALTPDSPPKPRGNHLPTPARSLSPELVPKMEEGRIIGATNPLKDFNINISRGDLVTKAVEDLAFVICSIIVKPFAGRRTAELEECMKAMRDTCLKEDEIEAWNAFLKELKATCGSYPGNKAFWNHLKTIGRSISLISDGEAKQYCGTSDVTEEEAVEFLA
ncbi:SPOC domain-like protein [Mycena floridula]|nr:SPOC domain-like protein [Mycena floridula]